MSNANRRRVVPETIQTSGMDCGPAALRSLLAGFGLRAGYGGLREACRTDVDGTSIEALEAAANALGLESVQVMLPADHVIAAGAAVAGRRLNPASGAGRISSSRGARTVAGYRSGSRRWDAGSCGLTRVHRLGS